MNLLAAVGGYTIAQYAIAAIVILAVAAIVLVAARAFGMPIPQWIWQVLGIVLAAVVCIVAIKFVAGL